MWAYGHTGLSFVIVWRARPFVNLPKRLKRIVILLLSEALSPLSKLPKNTIENQEKFSFHTWPAVFDGAHRALQYWNLCLDVESLLNELIDFEIVISNVRHSKNNFMTISWAYIAVTALPPVGYEELYVRTETFFYFSMIKWKFLCVAKKT